MSKTLLHVDMDAFFASVEMLHHPEWRDKPLIVGAGPHERGVVSTCNYVARKYGVHSAMPSRTAYQLCPHAIFTYPHMNLYEAASAQAFEVFGHYSPFVEGVSIDEAFLDVTGTLHLYRDAMALGEALRREIRETSGLTCSVGIAANRLLAKIGSEQHKPDGLTLMPREPDAVAAFLAPRPVSILWGIGKKTEALLATYGIVSCGQLQRMDEVALARILGSVNAAKHLRAHAFGISDDTVNWRPVEDQSVSREHTFRQDAFDREAVRAKLLELVSDVGRRFRAEQRWARTAKIKLRDTVFHTVTRQMSFASPVRDDISFRQAALELFDRENIALGVRLIGFGVTNIVHSPYADAREQGLLFTTPEDDRREKRERLSATLDHLHERGGVKDFWYNNLPPMDT